MKRVVIIGCAGSGKTSLAKTLSALTGNPVVHIDTILWTCEGRTWIKRPTEEIRELIQSATAGDSWIFEGEGYSNISSRICRADTLIFLDLPTATCLMRVIKRMILTYDQPRDDLAQGCRERFDFGFLKWVMEYRKTTRPKALQLLLDAPNTIEKHHFKNAADVVAFVQNQRATSPQDV